MFKDFKDLLVTVIIFISVYFTNKQHSIVLINIHFNKQQRTVFPPPANKFVIRYVFIIPIKNLGSDQDSSSSAD